MKVRLQDWKDPEIEKFAYLGSCVSASGGVSDDIHSCIVKARASQANLRHLRHLHDVSLIVKSWV